MTNALVKTGISDLDKHTQGELHVKMSERSG